MDQTEQASGRRVWNLLHSLAAYYPEQPSQEEKENTKQFFQGFMTLAIERKEWGDAFLQDFSKDKFQQFES